MIYLTYTYHRDVFQKGGNFKPWVRKRLGESAKFHGFHSGMYYPTVRISPEDFEKNKSKIAHKNLTRVRGEFTKDQIEQGCLNFDFEIVKECSQ